MNKDLIIGIVVSLTLHAGFFGLFNHHAGPAKKVQENKDPVVQFEMPPPDDEKDDKPKELDDTPVENVLAPPSLMDLPSIVPVQAFTQPLTPPPPPGMTLAKGAITIPVNPPGANFGKGISNLFNIGDLDQKPIAQFRQSPTFPYEMSRAGITGQVTLEFIINANGDVIDARVIHSTHREFEQPAIVALMKWKFKPGKKGGHAVNTRASQLLEFTLDDNK